MTHRRPRAHRLAVAALVTLLAAGCGQVAGLLEQPPQVIVDNQGQRVTAIGLPDPVTQLPREKKFDAVYAAFFPGRVVVHPGDTVFFKLDSRGEPHTIALGTLINRAGRQLDELGLLPLLTDSEAVPALAHIPSFFPLEPEDGEPIRVNRSAAEACYLQDGVPPNSMTGGAPPCASDNKPAFDGTQAFYSSGWLRDRKIFKVKLAEDIKPGTYHVMDLVHRSTMRMKLVVRPKSWNLPNIKDRADDTRIELVNQASRLKISATAAWTVTDPTRLVAGVGTPGSGSVVASFPHETTKLPVGGKATWTINGMHSITFNSPDNADNGPLERSHGKVVANPDAWNPANSGNIPAAAQAWRTAGPLITVNGGTYNGTGNQHSGILLGTTEAATTYTLTFTKPGTYNYHCVIHPVMTGKIEVGDKTPEDA